MPINSHKFHEGQLQWNPQQPSEWVKRMNWGKSFSDWSCPQLPLPHCIGASPRDQKQLHWGLADGITEGHSPVFFSLLSHLLLLIFTLPPLWAVTVLAMLALDKWMIYRLKVIRKCFLFTLLPFAITLPNTCLKKINLFSSNMITGY